MGGGGITVIDASTPSANKESGTKCTFFTSNPVPSVSGLRVFKNQKREKSREKDKNYNAQYVKRVEKIVRTKTNKNPWINRV